jgi:hypothetical protein
MAEENFRVQYLRGTTTENNAYTGRVGELTIDTTLKTLRIHDGAVAGGSALVNATAVYTKAQVDTLLSSAGSANPSVLIQVNSWSSNAIVVPTGVTVTKEYDSTSLRIAHNKNKYPTGWFGYNRDSSPISGIVPTALRNIQIVNLNEVIITSLSSFEAFNLVIQFQ